LQGKSYLLFGSSLLLLGPSFSVGANSLVARMNSHVVGTIFLVKGRDLPSEGRFPLGRVEFYSRGRLIFCGVRDFVAEERVV
jgi:hypothetical protein